MTHLLSFQPLDVHVDFAVGPSPGHNGIFDDGHPHVRFLADLPLSSLRTVCFHDENALELSQLANRFLGNVEDLTLDSKDISLQDIYDLLSASHSDGIPFPVLRRLVIYSVDLEDLLAEEFCEVLGSRAVPISEMVVVFRNCDNAKQEEITALAQCVTVHVEAEGRLDGVHWWR